MRYLFPFIFSLGLSTQSQATLDCQFFLTSLENSTLSQLDLIAEAALASHFERIKTASEDALYLLTLLKSKSDSEIQRFLSSNPTLVMQANEQLKSLMLSYAKGPSTNSLYDALIERAFVDDMSSYTNIQLAYNNHPGWRQIAERHFDSNIENLILRALKLEPLSYLEMMAVRYNQNLMDRQSNRN